MYGTAPGPRQAETLSEEADRRAFHLIKQTLTETAIPLLSLEGEAFSEAEDSLRELFWLVAVVNDTEGFDKRKRSSEFTTNISLIRNGFPILGVVYAPAMNTLYFGGEGAGSFKLEAPQEKSELANLYRETAKALAENAHNATNEQQNNTVVAQTVAASLAVGKISAQQLPIGTFLSGGRPYTITVISSQSGPETNAFINDKKQQYGNVDIVASSLPFCLVAEGTADIYPCLAPTKPWVTAAGHAIAKFAGCRVIEPQSGTELRYNNENMLNPSFIVER
jgi:3'(2'), 5'-bisphosphate nucleotidase